MKFDYKKLKTNDFVQILVLSMLTVIIMLLIIECPVKA